MKRHYNEDNSLKVVDLEISDFADGKAEIPYTGLTVAKGVYPVRGISPLQIVRPQDSMVSELLAIDPNFSKYRVWESNYGARMTRRPGIIRSIVEGLSAIYKTAAYTIRERPERIKSIRIPLSRFDQTLIKANSPDLYMKLATPQGDKVIPSNNLENLLISLADRQVFEQHQIISNATSEYRSKLQTYLRGESSEIPGKPELIDLYVVTDYRMTKDERSCEVVRTTQMQKIADQIEVTGAVVTFPNPTIEISGTRFSMGRARELEDIVREHMGLSVEVTKLRYASTLRRDHIQIVQSKNGAPKRRGRY